MITGGFTIVLRAVEPEDLDLMYEWENDRTVWQAGSTLTPFSRYRLRRFIEEDTGDILKQQQLRLMIDLGGVDGGQTRTVGSIDIFEFDALHLRAGVGILIAAADDRRKGYAAEALRQTVDYSRKILLLHQLWCSVAAGNRASMGLFEGAGFVKTGIRRDWLRTERGWTDEYMLQLVMEQE